MADSCTKQEADAGAVAATSRQQRFGGVQISRVGIRSIGPDGLIDDFRRFSLVDVESGFH